MIEAYSEDMINTKTNALKTSGSIDSIVKALKSPTKEEHNMLKDHFTKKDMNNMMFLDTTKGLFETTKIADKLMDNFSPHIVERSK